MARQLVVLVAGLMLLGVGAGLALRSYRFDDAADGPALSRDDVRQVQHRLMAKGFYDGRVDGVIGPATREALRRYQKDNGLEETARLDAPTAERLTGPPVPGTPTDAGASGLTRDGEAAGRGEPLALRPSR
jgi:peptidoglycan hydrolase-like protein with peptidoglycan-binding domain